MSKEPTSPKWISTAYDLFAHEGPAGIHIERIARLLNLNKSSFYHHFGTLEVFYEELIQYHYQQVDQAMKNVHSFQNLDPDYLEQMLKHKVIFMSQVQLVRHKNNPLFAKAVQKVNKKIDESIMQLWQKHLRIHNSELALKYLSFVRDTFYARVSFDNFDYPFLQGLIKDSKYIIDEVGRKALQTNDF